ncbi:hypothetical protein [Candidatus Nitrospira bockiana]
MEVNRFVRHIVMVGSLTVIAYLSGGPTQAADQSSAGTSGLASVERLHIMASGAAEDTLVACLGRIPKDASAGLQLIAQQGCERDEEARKSIQGLPHH